MLKEIIHHHSCEPNRARVTAEFLRHKMKNIVRKNPVQAVGKAVRAVRVEAAHEYSEDEDFYLHLISELGCDSALEKQLLRVRAEIIGQTPKSRNEFDAQDFLKRVFGPDDNVVVCDLNTLEDGWREEIDRLNKNSDCVWTKLDDKMIYYMDRCNNKDDKVEDDASDSSDENFEERYLSKRVFDIFQSKEKIYFVNGNGKVSIQDDTLCI